MDATVSAAHGTAAMRMCNTTEPSTKTTTASLPSDLQLVIVDPPLASTGSFLPSHLVGVLYGFWDGEIKFIKAPRDDDDHAVEAMHTFLHRARDFINSYEPVASRAGLVVFRRLSPSALCICNPMTGYRLLLPRPAICDESQVLLTGAGGRFSFQLHVVNLELLAYKVLQIQTFSSETGKWGPVVPTFAPLPPSRFLRPSPLVLNGVVYWLCKSEELGCYVLALRLDGSRPPALIQLPAKLLCGRTAAKKEELLLASSPADGRLRLVVARSYKISIWTLVSSSDEEEPVRWAQSTVIDLCRLTQSEETPPLMGEKVRLECFAESSCAVLFQMYHGTLYELNLMTGEVRFVGIYSKRSSSPMCAYDMDPCLRA